MVIWSVGEVRKKWTRHWRNCEAKLLAKMLRLATELESQFAESEKMEVIIGANLKSLNFTT